MRRLLPAAFSLVLVAVCVRSVPAAAFAGQGTRPGPTRVALLDPCQERFARALRFLDGERKYVAEKERFREITARRCAEKCWYDIGFVGCVLLVPAFGVLFPFFGGILLGSLRAKWGVLSTRTEE